MQSEFDIQRDHLDVVRQVMKLLTEDGQLYFSCNLRKFKLDEDKLGDYYIKDITRQTIPPDFKCRQNIHRCWIIQHKAH